MTPFPWKPAMQFGFGVLRLSSSEFWGLSPRELAAAFEAHSGRHTTPPPRTAMDAMMRRFPDGEARNG